MNDEDALLSGQLSPWPSKDRLAEILRAAGLRIDVGRYAIRISDCEHFSFQHFGGDLGEPSIDADAETTERLIQDAQRVSGALATAGIRHRFEVYDGNDELAAYVHHDWPAGT
jgi:hypothetical protein